MNAYSEYAAYFLSEKAECYGADGQLRTDVFELSEFQTPHAAIQEKLEDPFSHSLKVIVKNKDAYLPAIERFLEKQNIPGLAFWGWGGSAAAFEAQIEGGISRMILRIGTEVSGSKERIRKFVSQRLPSMAFNRPWCPLSLKSDVHTAFIHQESVGWYDSDRLSLELMPMVPVLPEKRPQGFDYFLNEHILIGTPYAVDENKDLGLLPDGTPVYVDPDSLNFADAASARLHAKDQFKPEWQQEIMAVIAENCRKAGWPEELSWVVLGRVLN